MNLTNFSKHILPTSGNIIFTVFMITITLWAQSAGAINLTEPNASSACTIPYQGYLADEHETPLDGNYEMTFRLYKQANNGTAIWTEQWAGTSQIAVEEGLFHIILGSLTEIPRNIIIDNDALFLGITIGSSVELTPRQEIERSACYIQPLIADDDGHVAINGSLSIQGNLNMNSVKSIGPIGQIRSIRNIYGHGEEGTTAEIHMPDGVHTGDMYLNWKQGRKLIYGGGKEQAQMSVDTDGNMFIRGDLQMSTAQSIGPLRSLSSVHDIYGHGADDEKAQIHMPGGDDIGNIYFNWYQGKSLYYGGGKEQVKMSVNTDGNMYLRGNLRIDGESIDNVVTINGRGPTEESAQIHMPHGESDKGNLYLNWYHGQTLYYGGGKEQIKMSVDTDGNLWVAGELQAAGAKPAIVETESYGRRKMYAVEDAEVRFTDEGIGTLENGIARIDLDPIFMETIEGAYIVHVTPYGDAMLYVDERAEGHFTVKAREADSNIEFAWRISAIRKGYGDVRMEAAE